MQWTNEAGQRRIKPVEKLLRDIDWQARTEIQVSRFGQHEVTPLCGANRGEPMERLREIGQRYAWTATVGNIKALTADLEQLLAWTKDTRSVIDKREPATIRQELIAGIHNG